MRLLRALRRWLRRPTPVQTAPDAALVDRLPRRPDECRYSQPWTGEGPISLY